MSDPADSDALRSIQSWIRFANTERYVEALRRELVDRKTFQAFVASDGTRTQRQVAEAAGVSQPTVSRLWKRWSQQGIMITSTERPSHLLAPSEVGIERPVADET